MWPRVMYPLSIRTDHVYFHFKEFQNLCHLVETMLRGALEKAASARQRKQRRVTYPRPSTWPRMPQRAAEDDLFSRVIRDANLPKVLKVTSEQLTR